MVFTSTAAAVNSGLVAKADVPAPPHPMGLLGWIGPVGPDGEEVYYQGVDLADIDAQVTADHPGISLFDNSLAAFRNETAAEEGKRSLVARDHQNCDVSNWGLVSHIGIQTGINHLGTVGRCVVQARQCIRTTCNQNEGIVWCNDNTYALDFPCSSIADMATLAVWECENWRDIPFPNVPSTQRFHDTERWNVILAQCQFFSAGGQPT